MGKAGWKRRALVAACAVAFMATAHAGEFGRGGMSVRWALSEGHIGDVVVTDRINRRDLPIVAPFQLTLVDGKVLGAADFRLDGEVGEQALKPDPRASRAAERLPGRIAVARFTDAEGRFRIEQAWVQREGSDYLRERVTITALRQDEAIARVDLLQAKVPDSEVRGSVDGSPVVSEHDWFGFENPLSKSEVRGGNQVRLWIERELPLRKGQSVTYSAAVGATHDNQLRRGFLAYVERERAHPYRTFLHYNSWYDIGYFTPYTAAQAVERIDTIGRELATKRGVTLDSFLFDDGWDDRSGTWAFSKDFPDGFRPLVKAAKAFGAAPGMWLSPWGGYGPPAKERAERAGEAGYEIVDHGMALSGPKYYRRFHDVTLALVKEGINQFKFDGTGNANKVFPGSVFDSDFDAAIHLIDDLRAAKPDLFINLTTGTLASPFWLRYADSIWRDGEDDELAGVGSKRERWITYRDRETYHNIVEKGPLFPLNALMLHGIIYARENRKLNSDPGEDFANEVHSYFGSGTALQELYVTPELLSAENWDTLAEAAKWSRANAGVLRDTHWIGGDPGRLDVYGWASWTPAKAILTLRNPSDKAQLAVIDLDRQLELPPGAVRRFRAHSPWKADASQPGLVLDADKPQTVTLQPFQVLTLELMP
ncbi:enterotoxin [Luteibacter aegosomatis]|uniref:enterotoxin n=1 Tax=Luteibacter aegosomatis TaxID=2911537 RepID=UPI001FFB6E80|nr:enterotoxin [Luteibacter aegosomatis]UPG84370.1 enterotoxin [Luteibacter aegosomatis]